MYLVECNSVSISPRQSSRRYLVAIGTSSDCKSQSDRLNRNSEWREVICSVFLGHFQDCIVG